MPLLSEIQLLDLKPFDLQYRLSPHVETKQFVAVLHACHIPTRDTHELFLSIRLPIIDHDAYMQVRDNIDLNQPFVSPQFKDLSRSRKIGFSLD